MRILLPYLLRLGQIKWNVMGGSPDLLEDLREVLMEPGGIRWLCDCQSPRTGLPASATARRGRGEAKQLYSPERVRVGSLPKGAGVSVENF